MTEGEEADDGDLATGNKVGQAWFDFSFVDGRQVLLNIANM
jgi:hypothetical protein